MKTYIVMRDEYPVEAFLSYEMASQFRAECKLSGLAIVSIPLQTDSSVECDFDNRLQPSSPDTTGYFSDGSSLGILPSCPVNFREPAIV